MKKTRSWFQNVRTDSDPFFELVCKTYSVHFSCLLRHGNFCKGYRTCERSRRSARGRVLRVRGLVFPTSNRLETWLTPSRTTRSRQQYDSTGEDNSDPLEVRDSCCAAYCPMLCICDRHSSTIQQEQRVQLNAAGPVLLHAGATAATPETYTAPGRRPASVQ